MLMPFQIPFLSLKQPLRSNPKVHFYNICVQFTKVIKDFKAQASEISPQCWLQNDKYDFCLLVVGILFFCFWVWFYNKEVSRKFTIALQQFALPCFSNYTEDPELLFLKAVSYLTRQIWVICTGYIWFSEKNKFMWKKCFIMAWH